ISSCRAGVSACVTRSLERAASPPRWREARSTILVIRRAPRPPFSNSTPVNSGGCACSTRMIIPTSGRWIKSSFSTPSLTGRIRPIVIREKTMRGWTIGAILMAVAAATPAKANLNVFACEPEWAALATEIGGDKVSVYSATTGQQDPHQIQARPGLIARARNADIAVCTGAELEIGWLPQILVQTSNQKIRPGAPG